ncbi:SRPBCC family protein [Primorskyibacter sp. S87]|uniref:SRPBCC family protein n=1 Tax=Primorskyibacter sp. S87 TaxID=3415126 RepID=UPI003C7E73C9
MTRTLILEHTYPADPDRLFDLVTDLDTLDAVTRPWLLFEHLPSGQVHTGQVFDVGISLFGILPERPYRMEVTLCDTEARCMVSEENGFSVRKLVHRLEVQPDPAGALLTDRIEIDAGWFTHAVAGWIRLTHVWRHRIRLKLLRQQRPRENSPS